MHRYTLLIAMVAAACSCQQPPESKRDGRDFCPKGEDLAAFVDPMIGTKGSGNSVPAALVPHGMVKLGPDTNASASSVDAYRYEDTRIEGFTHTHLQGPGGSANGYSQILIMPTVGPLMTQTKDYSSAFSHASEEASPGYYAVTLDDYKVKAELTATAHAGFHRYTFPASSQAQILLDLGHSLGESRDGKVEVLNSRTLEGYGVYLVHPVLFNALLRDEVETSLSKVYFHARFSTAFSTHGTWKDVGGKHELTTGAKQASGQKIGAWVGFTTTAKQKIEVQIGISMVSTAQARRNLEAEVGTQTFDAVAAAARRAWNCRLNRVQVQGGTVEQKTVFYTALYHTLMAPADYTEVGGVFYSAADSKGAVTTWQDRHFFTDDWCAWDTFRTSRPLATMVEPATVDDVVASYLHLYQQGGWLPKCTWHASGYSRVMIGNHAVSIIADAMVKGFNGFDSRTAWAAVEKSATKDNKYGSMDAVCGYFNLGVPPDYLKLGYVSHECDFWQSASMTLEYAYNDWCIARMASHLGKTDQQSIYTARAANYKKQFNPKQGFMQGRRRNGSWVEPFDPTSTAEINDFCEASSWIYTWFVPHDVPGLVSLLGGTKAFVAKLDKFFADGHFEISNEPSFHIPFLYNRAGAPDKAQARVRAVLNKDFTSEPNGLPGNDDAGATSAWYVLAAMGLYPVAPGDGRYDVTSPIFTRVTLQLNPAFYKGETFVIEAPAAGAKNLYIKSATLNGEPLSKPMIEHKTIAAGGKLVLQLGPSPSSWGAGKN